MLEELDDVPIDTSRLKQYVSMDAGRGRDLYKGQVDIDRIGHVLINGNMAPNLGQDPAIWDRAIYIPWDAKYIGEDDGDVDPSKSIFRQDLKVKTRLMTLGSAMMTVCLTDFTHYLKKYPEANSFRVPQCVTELINAEREKINPVPVFLEKYLNKTIKARSVTIDNLHSAFHGFCRLRYNKNTMDYAAFQSALGKTKYELVTNVTTKELVIKDYVLNEAGLALFASESKKRGFVSADNMDIPHLFKRQRMNF